MSLELGGAIGLLALSWTWSRCPACSSRDTCRDIRRGIDAARGGLGRIHRHRAGVIRPARWIGNKLGADDALLRYEETGHNIVSDDGARVHIAHWNHYDETLVEYQNRMWPVKLLAGHQHRVGDYRVVEVKEHHLLIEPLGRRYWPKRRPRHT